MAQPSDANRNDHVPNQVSPGNAGPLTNHQVGNWRLLECCGSGTFGAVYRAQHVTSPTMHAAVKVLHGQWSSHHEFRARFLDEATAAAQARHENIVQIFDVGVSGDGICYMVMELLEGRTLRQVMDEAAGGLDPVRAIRIGVQVARALGAAHAQGIVHRDLKPDNIMIVQRHDNPEFVKVLDFGIARMRGAVAAHAATQPGRILGTLEYMAPELWRCLPDLDGRVDVYALGVILYWALVGRPPFEATTAEQWMLSHLTVPVCDPAAAGVPARLAAVVLKMVEKDREQRLSSMLEVATALQGACRTGGVPSNQHWQGCASPPPPIWRPLPTPSADLTRKRPRPGRDFRWALAIAIGVMLPLGAFAAIRSINGRQAPVEREPSVAQPQNAPPILPVVTPLAPLAPAAPAPAATPHCSKADRSAHCDRKPRSRSPGRDHDITSDDSADVAAELLDQAMSDYVGRRYKSAQLVALRIAASRGGDTARAWRLVASSSCQLRDVPRIYRAWRHLDGGSRALVSDVCGPTGLVR